MPRVQTRFGAFPRMHDNRCYVKSSHGRSYGLSRPLDRDDPGLDQKDTPSRWRFRPPLTLTFRSQALRPSSYGLRERFRPTCAPCSTQEATYWESTGDARALQNELPQFAATDFRRPQSPARVPPAGTQRDALATLPASVRVGPKRYAEPVALSSTAHVDFPISGLAAFLVRSSRAVSTYLRSVLDAVRNLEGRTGPRKAVL